MILLLKLLFLIAIQCYHYFEGWTEYKSWAGIKKPGVYHQKRLYETGGIYAAPLFAFYLGLFTPFRWDASIFNYSIYPLLLGSVILGQAVYEGAFTIQQGGWKNLWYKPYPYKLNLYFKTIVINREKYSRQLYAGFCIIGIILIWIGM